MVTRKEHPVDNMVVFSVHECQIKKLMPAFTASIADLDTHNILFQWMSIVLPNTLSIELLNTVALARTLLGVA